MIAITTQSRRRRRRLRDSKKPSATIPTAGMADIAFLLIIFFVITTVQANDRTQVDLPQSVARSETDTEDAIVVVTCQDGLVYKFSDGASPTELVGGLDGIRREAARVVRAHPARAFQVKADRDLSAKDVGHVLDALIEAGARRVVLLTEEAER